MTDANLKRYYQLHPEKYAQTRWDVSHLFIAVDRELPDAKAISEQRINAIAADLQTQQLESREKLAQRFAELARRESEGATAKDGGRIGWVSKPGDLPKSVLDAIRVTDQGTVSQVVLSPLGYHLVLVHDKTILEVPFEQVQDLGPLRRDAADALFEGLISLQRDAKVAWYLNELRPPVSSPPDSHLPSGGQASP